MPPASALPVAELCGSLIVGGFAGATLPDPMQRALAHGLRSGVILFKRNLPSVEAALELNRTILDCATGPTPLIAVDEEGGRVQRLPSPALRIPPLRRLRGRPQLCERLAAGVGRELTALGFNLNFAPLLDVDSNPHNPIIGDRAFSSEPDEVIECGRAYLCGLQTAGVLACVKHFPGHGDTAQDSHLELPYVRHPRERLQRIELEPFRALLPQAPSAMTAHVVYEAFDPGVPASRSETICTQLLRGQLGFAGVLFSDDLEMKALSAHASVEDNAVTCIVAGCDALLICEDFALQERALQALIHEVEQSRAFRARCEQAATRVLALRSGLRPEPLNAERLSALWQQPWLLQLAADIAALG